MENQNEESKTAVEETIVQPDSTEEIKTEQPVEEEDTTQKTEVVAEQEEALSKEEIERLKKKAQDFDAMVKSGKYKKLAEKLKVSSEDEEEVEYQKPEFDADEIRADAIRAAEEAAYKIVGSVRQEEFQKNISSAWDEWLAENPWADDDTIFKGITTNLRPVNSAKKEDLLAELDRAALSAHPRLYRESMERRIKSQLLVEQKNIDVGSGGSSATSVRKADSSDTQLNKEDLNIIDKFFGGDKERYLKVKNNN